MKAIFMRHGSVDKSSPLGEAAPLTDEGQEQAKRLAMHFQKEGLPRAIIIPDEADLPRFWQTVAPLAELGVPVVKLPGLSFKEMKGNVPIHEILLKYREAGDRLLWYIVEHTGFLNLHEEEPVLVVGSFPLVAAMKFETGVGLPWKPNFCTGVCGDVYFHSPEIEPDYLTWENIHDFRPLDS